MFLITFTILIKNNIKLYYIDITLNKKGIPHKRDAFAERESIMRTISVKSSFSLQ